MGTSFLHPTSGLHNQSPPPPQSLHKFVVYVICGRLWDGGMPGSVMERHQSLGAEGTVGALCALQPKYSPICQSSGRTLVLRSFNLSSADAYGRYIVKCLPLFVFVISHIHHIFRYWPVVRTQLRPMYKKRYTVFDLE